MGSSEDVIVIIEDDAHIADLVAMYLRRDGFRALLASNGEEGLALVQREKPRLVVLDIGLPGEMDGFDVCKALRPQGGEGPPVLILSARDDEIDRILGLELGADDYMTKPFSPRELVARVHAILRRATPQPPPSDLDLGVRTVGEIDVDLGRREVRLGGDVIEFTAREFDLLTYLVTNPGLALSRRQLLDGVWGADWYGDERTVDVHVRQLRKKLGTALPLQTVWGVGYRLG